MEIGGFLEHAAIIGLNGEVVKGGGFRLPLSETFVPHVGNAYLPWATSSAALAASLVNSEAMALAWSKPSPVSGGGSSM